MPKESLVVPTQLDVLDPELGEFFGGSRRLGGVGADESSAPLRRPRLTEVGCGGAEDAELSGGDVGPTAESSGSVEGSAVTGVGYLAEADSAPARGALGGVSKVEAWPPGWPELGGELGPAFLAADDANGGAVVGETAGAVSAGGEPLVETEKTEKKHRSQ
ncbi:unnamed protein product [Phytophthora fragariaefolia]|uniref:Unnamed protein product n=1 Tax=Phytophthora fragariaefolia TaxID=1490495 RepID=A0A9W7D497_9STRA|nr:unnamed protein product [Phytophthora fragariaefolia]